MRQYIQANSSFEEQMMTEVVMVVAVAVEPQMYSSEGRRGLNSENSTSSLMRDTKNRQQQP
jgi:hypothetical protein